MSAQRCDGCRENSNKFPARNKRCRELDGHSFHGWLGRLKIVRSKYVGNERAWCAVVGWQDPVAFDDILKRNSAFARKFALRSHNEDKGLVEQDLGMEAVFYKLSCGSRDQQINFPLPQFPDLMFAWICELHVQLNAGIFL